MPIFRVKSVQNLHLPEKFTLTASAASATIIWYACNLRERMEGEEIFFLFVKASVYRIICKLSLCGMCVCVSQDKIRMWRIHSSQVPC